MNLEVEKLWTAYLDGELSASEAAEFDKSLTSEERKRLSAEMRLETGIASSLTNSAGCPDVVWKRVRARIQSRQRGLGLRVLRHIWIPAAAAAVLLFAFFLMRGGYQPAQEDFLTVPISVEALLAKAEVPGNPVRVQQFLGEHNIDVLLKSSIELAPGHHAVLLGAREDRCDGETIIQLFYECCGEPIKIVIAREQSAMAREMARATGKGSIQASGRAGDFRIAILSEHSAKKLLDLFSTT